MKGRTNPFLWSVLNWKLQNGLTSRTRGGSAAVLNGGGGGVGFEVLGCRVTGKVTSPMERILADDDEYWKLALLFFYFMINSLTNLLKLIFYVMIKGEQVPAKEDDIQKWRTVPILVVTRVSNPTLRFCSDFYHTTTQMNNDLNTKWQLAFFTADMSSAIMLL